MHWLGRLNRFFTFGQAPDPGARARLELVLQARQSLGEVEWAHLIAPDESCVKATTFVFKFFRDFYNIDLSRSRPEDLLHDDLAIPRSLWSDWELDFAEEFKRLHNGDLFSKKDVLEVKTLGELVVVLANKLTAT